jgi:hypothetical protein
VQREVTLWIWLTHDAAGFFTSLLAAIAAAQAGLFVWQLKLIRRTLADTKQAADAARDSAEAAKESVDLSRQTSERQLRAYVLIDGGSIVLVHTEAGRKFLKVDVLAKNYGQTPAYNFRTWHRVDIIDTDFLPSYEGGEGEQQSIMGPGGERAVTLHKGPISDSELIAIRNNQKTIRVWGRYDYTDAFGRNRYLQFYLQNGRELLKGGGWPIVPSEKQYEGN